MTNCLLLVHWCCRQQTSHSAVALRLLTALCKLAQHTFRALNTFDILLSELEHFLVPPILPDIDREREPSKIKLHSVQPTMRPMDHQGLASVALMETEQFFLAALENPIMFPQIT